MHGRWGCHLQPWHPTWTPAHFLVFHFQSCSLWILWEKRQKINPSVWTPATHMRDLGMMGWTRPSLYFSRSIDSSTISNWLINLPLQKERKYYKITESKILSFHIKPKGIMTICKTVIVLGPQETRFVFFCATQATFLTCSHLCWIVSNLERVWKKKIYNMKVTRKG